MRKSPRIIMVIILIIAMVFMLSGCQNSAATNKSTDKNSAQNAQEENDGIVSAENLQKEMKAKDADAAYCTWLKAMAAVISKSADSAYDCASGAGSYAGSADPFQDKANALRKLMQSDDIWTEDINLPRNKEYSFYTDLNNAVIGYKNMKMYTELMDSLNALKPTAPEKYSMIDKKVDIAVSTIHRCNDEVNAWINDSQMKVVDMWEKMEKLYWDSNITTLQGMLYIDSRLSK